jgi:hypothetical protein
MKDNKVKKDEVKTVEEAFKGKTDEELAEILTTLQTQLQHHQTMAVKAQGAVEVIAQMIKQSEEGGEGKE